MENCLGEGQEGEILLPDPLPIAQEERGKEPVRMEYPGWTKREKEPASVKAQRRKTKTPRGQYLSMREAMACVLPHLTASQDFSKYTKCWDKQSTFLRDFI